MSNDDPALRTQGRKILKGKKVRVHPQDVRFIKGEPRDSTNTVVVHQQEG